MSEQWFERDPLWFKRAVFYEIHIRGFFDGNDDGSGDFRGLTEKLDYLQWLGVDCLWVPPFFTSPLRDGGYDVADYTDILPASSGLAPAYRVRDVVSESEFTWHLGRNYVRLEPGQSHVLVVRR